MLKLIKSLFGSQKQPLPTEEQELSLTLDPESLSDTQLDNLSRQVLLDEAEKITMFQLVKISNDCATLIGETTNPDVFFSRYELLVETLTKLTHFENYDGLTFYEGKPSEKLKKALDPQFYETIVNDFINRSYQKSVQDASKLKTESGRKNRTLKYFSIMEPYKSKMNGSTLDLLDDLKRQAAGQ